jgi:hypothetical protein
MTLQSELLDEFDLVESESEPRKTVLTAGR